MSAIEIQTPEGPLLLEDSPFEDLRKTTDAHTPLPRLAYAATHVVMHDSYRDVPHAPDTPGSAESIAEHLDWETTMDLRRRIGAQGLGIAEAMDTSQRFSLGWEAARELIRMTGELDLQGGFCAGATSDQLNSSTDLPEVIDAVVEQIHFIRSHRGVPVILPIPLLSESDMPPDAYVKTYQEIIAQAPEDCPLIIHWLGEMFLPKLEGYFPEDSFQRVMRSDPAKIRGAKISLLNHQIEVSLRKELLGHDQILFTGDDFNFGGLMAGNQQIMRHVDFDGRNVALGDFSHALLGIFDAIAGPAALALRRLGQGDRVGYDRIMNPCEELGKTIFESPTRHYKTGLAFLAWINGLQANPMLVNHEQRCREQSHLLRVADAASSAGAILNARQSAQRIEEWLA